MGVRGLESFMERDPYGCKKLDIGEAVARYRKPTGEPIVIVVDACSCLGRLYRPLPWIPGGQMKEYEEVVERLVERFRSLGVEPFFFFDGPLRENKVTTWIKRKTEAIVQVANLFDNIKSGQSVENIEKIDARLLLLDNNDRLTIDILKRLHCKVFNSILECDEEIAKYALENHCMAILGQDSDFLIYPGPWHYWSSKHFDLNAMTTMEYDRRRLEQCLRLPRDQLPIWASLMGNDVLPFDDLQGFHNELRARGYRGQKAYQVARYVNESYRSRKEDFLSRIGSIFPNSKLRHLLVESVSSYDIYRVDSSVSKIRYPEDKNWDKILQIVVEKHINNDFPFVIYGIMVLQSYKSWECKEDYNNKDLPPNQKVLKKLRQKMYGILLHEKPQPESGNHQVKELVVAGPGTFDRFDIVDPILPTVRHPGLLTLWNERDNQDSQWDLFCGSFGIEPSSVRGVILDEYVIPVLSLFYLLEEGVKMKRWEVEAIVASIVTLASYSTKQLGQLLVTLVDPRAVHLYTLVARSFSTVYTLNVVCGSPVPLEKTYFSLYQDGKLFHVKYVEAKKGATASELCEKKELGVEMFRLIMNLLPSEQFIE